MRSGAVVSAASSTTSLTRLHLIPAFIADISYPGELTIGYGPFFVEQAFDAVALPTGDCLYLKLDPLIWSEFKITQIANHGSRVAKGDPLIRFGSDRIDDEIAKTRSILETASFLIAQAAQELETLTKTAPIKLEYLRRAAETAKKEKADFDSVGRITAAHNATHAMKRSRQILINQREELKQLARMYEADNITKEAEEMILVRQQDAVSAAEFALRMEMLDHKRTLEVSLPRETKALEESARDTAINLENAEIEIPHSIQLSMRELETLTNSSQHTKILLSELEQDRKKFAFDAPAEGWFYHGATEDVRWTTCEPLDALIPGGSPSITAAFATFVPFHSEIALIAFVSEAVAQLLAANDPEISAHAIREEMEIPAQRLKLASSPDSDGFYRVDLAVTWPEDIPPPAGDTIQIRVITYQQATAIAIPTRALKSEANGWTVEVKLADGKTQLRKVIPGRASQEATEIVSGLEVGEIIVVF